MRILCVYAHPDDEAFGPSAILAKYARRGARIHAVYFTRGEHGNTSVEPKPGPDELAAQARDHGEPDSAQHGHEPQTTHGGRQPGEPGLATGVNVSRRRGAASG